MESDRADDAYAFRLEVLVPPTANLRVALDEIRRIEGVRTAEASKAGSPLARGPLDE
jgi:hypothetical protein